MQDLLQETGRQIVRQKSIVNPGKRCRLWKGNDIHHVLTRNIGTEAVQGMFVERLWEQSKTFSLSGDVFLKMTKLRLLKLLYLEANSGDVVYLSTELRLINWPGFPFKSLWNLLCLVAGSKNCGRERRLKLVDLKNSESLPELSTATDLQGCTSLVDVHPKQD
ncbi:probable WRKY transcription factor 19 [Hibiscus syriacus]|uniref:probable WRKY transcription factor 19 n=1 Tax=Hibiscus syriacus TaxID=106335 RepID=UPI0019248809|nr:probable WRKY transcription factor 19 [Hibiscus syriacus]